MGPATRRILLRKIAAMLVAGVLLTGCGSKGRPECETEPPPIGRELETTAQATAEPLTADQIQILWESGPHARSHEFDNASQEANCARCHAPESWAPTEGEQPMSWLEAGVNLASLAPSTRAGSSPVGCAICHSGGSDEIEGEIAWLEVPPVHLYTPVETATELCEKCHLAGDIENHVSVVVSGSHLDLSCVECHDAHDTTADCTGSGCHEPFAVECEPIETHDKPHRETSCAACHDADGLAIDWNEGDQVWDTVIPSSTGDGYRIYASHALVLEVACERCHEPGNHPWGETKE